ncbi:IS66 family insertion sequence element accessory protein TnpB [Lacticaseibacillus rhamnosus]|uniref:IS66 family insertion sequence element accessory protein TnpB n=1 Tax=Lacticaseibacillus rhamnosus TaxID=47715 RepID=UPI0023E0CD6F|nr:IS66 family insertion sequence element accessory protein TnpB [Lacticaseibacillus rhamnosus]MDF3333837.1 IS66 family insertion sequence element accessory protein TnpB [Lacticaseibacillus rhamnosus]
MVPDLSKANIYIICGRTDLRKGIVGLAALVTEEYQMDVFDNALFIFCSTRKDRFKALYWTKNGFLLLYKRFEDGAVCNGRAIVVTFDVSITAKCHAWSAD